MTDRLFLVKTLRSVRCSRVRIEVFPQALARLTFVDCLWVYRYGEVRLSHLSIIL